MARKEAAFLMMARNVLSLYLDLIARFRSADPFPESLPCGPIMVDRGTRGKRFPPSAPDQGSDVFSGVLSKDPMI